MERLNAYEKSSDNPEITPEKLVEWRDDSLEIAYSMGANPDILSDIRKGVTFDIINTGDAANDVWYGYCQADKKRIGIKKSNPADYPLFVIENMLYDSGLEKDDIKRAIDTLESIEPSKRREMIGQSGMDHELIGHQYNYLDDQNHSEIAAVHTQTQMALARAELHQDGDWEKFAEIAPMVLAYHKSAGVL